MGALVIGRWPVSVIRRAPRPWQQGILLLAIFGLSIDDELRRLNAVGARIGRRLAAGAAGVIVVVAIVRLLT